jgi:ribosome-binding protein aMBF1 (putative translation factor)
MSIERPTTGVTCEQCGNEEPSVHVGHAGHDVRLCDDCNDRFWRGEIAAEPTF